MKLDPRVKKEILVRRAYRVKLAPKVIQVLWEHKDQMEQ